MATGGTNSSSSLNATTQLLVVKAYESLQNDVQSLLQRNNEMMGEALQKVVDDMSALRQGMNSMKTNLEYLHRENREGKKKIITLEEKLKGKEDEVEELKKELKELQEEQNDKIVKLEAFRTEVEEKKDKKKKKKEEKMKNSVKKNLADLPETSASSGFTNDEIYETIERSSGDGLLEGQPGTSTTPGVGGNEEDRTGERSSDKKFTFEDKVEGKNVMVGNDVAVVADGGPLSFMSPLQTNAPNSLLNKDAEIPGSQNVSATQSPGTNQPVNLSDIEGKFIGNEKVNVQSNVQQVFLPGSGAPNIEVEDGEKVKYRQADRDELAKFMERANEDAEDNEIIKLNADEELRQKDVILRVADLIKRDGKVEHFVRLCELLTHLSPRQLLSLAPDLAHIKRIDLTNVQINYKLLSAFFRCFKSKRFEWLLLRQSRINSADMRELASALGNCKVDYLDLGSCAFEYMAFFELSSVLLRVENVILRGLTAAQIVPENAIGALKGFSADEAQHLAGSISRCPKAIGLDLSSCDLRRVDLATAFSSCLDRVSALTLKFCLVTEGSMDALFSKIEKMRKLDLTCVDLRNAGVNKTTGLLGKVNVLMLCNVLLDDEGVQPLVDAMEKLPENAMDLIDLSSNPLNSKNVSILLKSVGKVKVMVFSTDQIEYSKHKNDIDEEKVLLSEVTDGAICRLDESEVQGFSHWVACAKPVENLDKYFVTEACRILPQEKEARALSQYRCSKCKTHIAFVKDGIDAPCASLYNDRSLWGILEQPHFATVSHAVSCVPSKNAAKRHSCSTPKCPLARYKMRGCKCAMCRQTIGGFYTNDAGNKFWCLYQESHGAAEVGTSKNACKQM